MKRTPWLIPAAAMLLLVTPLAARASLQSGLAGYWQFNGTGADSSGNSRDVGLQGAAGYGAGLLGQALSLDGVQGNFASRPVDDDVFDFGLGNFTVQVWANYNTILGEHVLIEKFVSTSGPGWTFTKLGNQSVRFHVDGFRVDTPVLALAAGQWTQFVARRDGNDVSIFVNGSHSVTGNTPLPVSNVSNPLLIGRRNSGDPRNFTTNGRLDEIGIWTRALGDAEIASLYNNGAGRDLTAVPEPASLAIFALGLVTLGALRLRRARPEA